MYDPLDDLAARYPRVVLDTAVLSPAHAALVGDRLLLVDASLDARQRRCSIAHEIAHLDLAHTMTVNRAFARRQEIEADRLASTRLISFEQLREAVRWCTGERDLAEQLQVSEQALSLRRTLLSAEEISALHISAGFRD